MRSEARKRLLFCVGTRPQFVKAAAILPELRKLQDVQTELVHTKQHHDLALSGVFFDDMDIPKPDSFLREPVSARQGDQIAHILRQAANLFEVVQPDGVLVVGDSNTTLACAIAAAKLNIPLAHYEAGLRGDFAKGEQKNQRMVDAVTSLHLATSEYDAKNLYREGHSESVRMVGNVLVDVQWKYRDKAKAYEQPALVPSDEYALVTLHKDVNMEEARLREIWGRLGHLSQSLPVVFPIHPKTARKIEDLHVPSYGAVHVIPSASYIQMLSLLLGAKVVVTDSGGLQEEAAAAGIPCVTLWRETERWATVESGWNRLAEPENLVEKVKEAVANKPEKGLVIEGWDGKAAGRIAQEVAKWLS